MCDMKLRITLYGGTTMPTYVFCEPHTVCNCTLVSVSAWKPYPCFVCVCMHKIQLFTGLHRAMPINWLLLQAPGVLPLQYVSFMWNCCKSRALSLSKITPTFSKHVLVPVNLLEPHTALCTTPTDPSLYLLAITSIWVYAYVAMYLQYATSTNSNVHQGFSYPGDI